MTTWEGLVWRFGDDVDTDAIIAADHLRKTDPGVWAAHLLERERHEFPSQVRDGDFVVAGENFGSGSAREHAAIAFRTAGVRAVLAESFARTFYRNALNNGLLVIEAPGIRRIISDRTLTRLDVSNGTVSNAATGEELTYTPIPPFLLGIVEAGGLIAWLRQTGGWSF